MKPKKLLADLIENVDTQSRVTLSQETIAEYVEAARKLPPADVFFDGDKYYLADGWHRYYAWEQAGVSSIPCVIHDGGLRDALLFAAAANQAHGLKRSSADKRRAVGIILADDEWSEWSDARIAEHCGVTHPFVAKFRADFEAESSRQVETVTTSEAPDGKKPRENATRVGRDGKRYPAPAAKPKPAPEAEQGAEDSGPNIARLAEPYVRACNDLVRIKKDLKAIARDPAIGAHLATKIVRIEKDVDDLRVNIAQTEPLSLCGKCGGDGCQHCARTGFWTRMTVNSLKK